MAGSSMEQDVDPVRDIGNFLGAAATHPSGAQQQAQRAAAALTACAQAMPGCAKLIQANNTTAEAVGKFAGEAASGLTAYRDVAHACSADYENGDQIGRGSIMKALQYSDEEYIQDVGERTITTPIHGM